LRPGVLGLNPGKPGLGLSPHVQRGHETCCCFSATANSCRCLLQARAAELAAREESLEGWKAEFRAQASRQMKEREGVLSEWAAALERAEREGKEAQRVAEVRRAFLLSGSCGVLQKQLINGGQGLLL
jgi:hypothetical protein